MNDSNPELPKPSVKSQLIRGLIAGGIFVLVVTVIALAKAAIEMLSLPEKNQPQQIRK